MEKKIRTIAFQVDDQDFVKEYEARVKESGMTVKNYFVSLIKNDILLNPVQKTSQVSDDSIKEDNPQPEQTNEEQAAEALVNTANTEQADKTPAPAEDTEQMENSHQQETDAPSEGAINIGDGADAPKPVEMMNFFAKVTKDQREALDQHKNETGETAGNVLNRLVNKFLDDLRGDNLSAEYFETLKYYSENIESCDTNWSAKVPSKSNQELNDYLGGAGATRNALMASLVHMELHSQDMAQAQTMTM